MKIKNLVTLGIFLSCVALSAASQTARAEEESAASSETIAEVKPADSVKGPDDALRIMGERLRRGDPAIGSRCGGPEENRTCAGGKYEPSPLPQ